MNKQKNLNNESGVTLVSLVVTIVVMLILAGVSISMVVGENGVGTRAQYAAIDTETANIQDALSQAVASANTAYQTDKATNRKTIETKKYYTAANLTKEGLDSAKLADTDIKYYKSGVAEYYVPNSNDETKAWCKVTPGAECATDDKVEFMVGTYDTNYLFVIDLKKGKVSVYPKEAIDSRTQSVEKDGGGTGSKMQDDSITDVATS